MNGNHILTKIDVYITIQTLLDNYASIDLMFAIRPYHPSFLDTDQGEQREGGGDSVPWLQLMQSNVPVNYELYGISLD